jgi:2-polyprenyl-3-methyl-5-hydroxy-6-metoxy-1,4-benzoquinol methylase
MNNPDQYYRNKRAEMLEFLPDKISRSIEFGCSRGLFSKKIKELHHAECWGVDLDSHSTENARQYLDHVICADAFDVIDTLPESYFDCLICNDFLEHLNNPGAFLMKLRKAMVPGAVVIASVPNVRSWSNVLELIVFKDWKYKNSGILDQTHLRFFTLKSFGRFLTESGLRIDLLKGIRPSSSKLFFLTDVMTLGFVHDMKFSGLATRSHFI